MDHSQSDYLILGAGLSGLYAAFRLGQKGFNVKVLEARDRIGGRIHTVNSWNNIPVEMGATWFGEQHKNLISLLHELKISSFEQHMDGNAFFEAFSTAPPQQIQFPKQPASFRIKNGTSTIINTLAKDCEINLSQIVKSIELQGDTIKVSTNSTDFYAQKVISTIPPALLFEEIRFTPSLNEKLIQVGRNTHTWMHDSIKFALVYDTPFWRKKGFSGTIFSNVGPITEFYDHCDYENNKYALCGFVNGSFASLPAKDRAKLVLNQIERTFGNDGLTFLTKEESVWVEEKFTSTQSRKGLFPHQNNGNPIFQNNQWNDKLIFAGTETSTVYGGYMDGAVARINEIISGIKPKS